MVIGTVPGAMLVLQRQVLCSCNTDSVPMTLILQCSCDSIPLLLSSSVLGTRCGAALGTRCKAAVATRSNQGGDKVSIPCRSTSCGCAACWATLICVDQDPAICPTVCSFALLCLTTCPATWCFAPNSSSTLRLLAAHVIANFPASIMTYISS